MTSLLLALGWAVAQEGPTTTCLPQVGDHRVVSGAVAVDFNDGTDPALAADVARWADDALVAFVDDLGWPPPRGSDRWLLPVALLEGGDVGGVTDVRACQGEQVAVIAVTAASLEDPVDGAVLLAHEVHHALQHATGAEPRRWFWEATATWASGLVTQGDPIRTFLPGLTRAGHLGLEATSRRDDEVFAHMYGASAWVESLAAEHGGPGAVLGLWEAGGDVEAPAQSVSVLDLLALEGIDPEPVQRRYLEALVRSPEPASGQLVEALSAAGEVALVPARLGWSVVWVPGEVRAEDALEATLTLDAGATWLVGWVGRQDGRAIWWTLGPDDEGAVLPLAAGAGDVALVMSPLSADGTSASWRIEAVPADQPPASCDHGPGGVWWVWLLACGAWRARDPGATKAGRRHAPMTDDAPQEDP